MHPNRNITLYPWFKFAQNLLFWQAVWFLYFQSTLSAAEAVMLYAVYDIATTALEVPSGYMSDRIGRRFTLICAAIAGFAGAAAIALGGSFAIFAVGQIMLGAASAFASGTDTSLLYESLEQAGRGDEVEAQELRAWRFTFGGLATSAVIGGAVALWAPALTFVGGALACLVMLAIAVQFHEPAEAENGAIQGHEVLRITQLKNNLKHPTLMWLFALVVLMYGFSHLPFVFGQPFILNALDAVGLGSQAPLVSGLVSAAMMIISVVVSLFALRLRRALGLPVILLCAFAIQILLAGALAISTSVLVIGVLLLRMVPNSLSQPFILARIQPLLHTASRATYLSLQSLVGRLVFAGSLLLASWIADDNGTMTPEQISRILGAYASVGVACLIVLAVAARRIQIETPKP